MVNDTTGRPERRQHPRAVVGIPVEAVRRELPQQDPQRVVGLRVTDLSRGGAGAIVHRPLPPADRVTLFFPPVGFAQAADTPGRVVRCEPRGGHWAVGILFETPLPDEEKIAAT